MDDKDDANTPPRGAGSAPLPQPSRSEQDVESESSDDDDWFNKSLDDFDIPTVKSNDLWSGEEEEDDKSVKTKQEKRQSKEDPDQKGTQKGKPAEKKKKKKEKKGQAASAHNSSTERQSHSSEDGGSEDEKVTEIWDTGVALAFRPGEDSGFGMRLQLARRRVIQSPPTEEQASKPEKTSTQDCAPTHAEEKDQRQDGRRTEAEKPGKELGTGARDKTRKKPKCEEGKLDKQQKDVVQEASTKRQRKQKGSKSKQNESVDRQGNNKKSKDEEKEEKGEEKGEEEDGKGREEEDGKGGAEEEDGKGGAAEEEDGKDKRSREVVYIDVEAEAVPEEELSEEWFAKQLAALPTLFNHRRVHQLSEARLRANITMLNSEVEEREENSSEEDNDSRMITALKNKVRDDDDKEVVTVVLMETDEGDYDVVMKFKQISDCQENMDGETEKRKVAKAIRLRKCMPTDFQVVLNWLLGKKQEAEAEARRIVGKCPFSLGAVANLFYMVWRRGERKEAAQLLSHFAMLKKLRPSVYEGIMCEEQRDLGTCYTELGPEFIPDAIAHMEKALQKKPHWYGLKWDVALNLRRLTNANHTWTQPMKDIVGPLLKATDLLLALIQDCGEDEPELKTAAAAELGEILNGCRFDEELKNTVGKRAEDAGLTAAKCFDMVMQVEDKGGSNLIRAGKFFRYSGQLHTSEKALKKAVAVQNSAKAHHQLALTLKRLVVEEKHRAFQSGKARRQGKKPPPHWVGPRRGESRQNLGVISRSRLQAGDTNMTSLQRAMRAVMYQSFTREDKYVSETMDHLNKAIMLSHGENCTVSYDLGLMYKALGEYSDALEQFRTIADIDTEPATIVGAFEQSGLVYLEKCSLEENETRARELKDEGKSLLTMAILVQAQIVRQFRDTDHFHAVWRSCHTLGQYLQLLQEVEGVFEEDSSVEIWLLRLLRVYADTLPVLVLLQQISQRDAESPQIVMDKLRKYFRDERYEDVVLYTSLLHLTQLGGKMKADGVSVRVNLEALVQTARSKLMAYIKAGRLGSTFNSNMARRFFRWAFEEIFLHGKDVCHHRHTSAAVAVCAPGRTGPPQNEEEKDSGRASPLEASASVAVNESRQDTGPPPLPNTRHEPTVGKAAEGRAAAHTAEEQRQNPRAAQGRTGATGEDLQEEGAVRQSWTPPWEDEVEEEDHKTLEYHVVLLHDPQDPEACRFSQDLHRVLLKTCGLKTYIQDPDSAMDLVTRATAEAMDSAHQLVFVIGSKEVSPVLESYIQHAKAKFPELFGMTATSRPSASHAISSLVLGDASVPLPPLLQNWPSLLWPSTSSFAVQQFGQTKAWVDSVCKLFCFLTGIVTTF